MVALEIEKMFDHLGDDAIKVILQANEESRRLGYDYIGAEQILIALLADESSIPAKTLFSRGLTRNVARDEVQRMTGQANQWKRFLGSFLLRNIPFTPRGKKAIEYSWDEAKRLEHEQVTPEHLLLGFLKEGRESMEANSVGVGIKILKRLEIDLNELAAEIERLVVERLLDIGKNEKDVSAHES